MREIKYPGKKNFVYWMENKIQDTFAQGSIISLLLTA